MSMITTFSGKNVDVLNLKEDDIDIRDIAHSLSLINRFNGHSRFPFNVASHSILVANIASVIMPESEPFPQLILLQALLHDASEAYLGDVTRWLKRSETMKGYREAEDRASAVIFKKFNCVTNPEAPHEVHPLVKQADDVAVSCEGTAMFDNHYMFEAKGFERNTDYYQFVMEIPWHQSEIAFLTAIRGVIHV